MAPISKMSGGENPSVAPADRPPLAFKRLSPECGRGAFSCGDDEIDKWFRNKSLNHHQNYRCRVVTAHLNDNPAPVGFFAMCIRLERDDQLDTERRAASRSQSGLFTSVQLNSVAVQRTMQRQGFGTVLMGAALAEFYEIVIRTGIYALTLVAANRTVVDFYNQLGFVVYGDRDTSMPKMILPAASVVELIGTAGASSPQIS
jgi:GNAT superfamily N-acetyltransferase